MTELQKIIIERYRETVAERYSLEYLRRFSEYERIPDHDIEAMREFFLQHVYPDPEHRENLEQALQALGDVLKSPRKLWHLLGASPFSKLGGKLPAALKAGLKTFEAFLKIRKLERKLDEEARSRDLTAADLDDRELFLELIRTIPEKEIEKFRRDGTALLETLADNQLLEVTLDIMNDSMEIMDEHDDVFAENERRGIATGYSILDGAYQLFQKLRPEEIPVIVAGIDAIEKQWFANLLAEAEAEKTV